MKEDDIINAEDLSEIDMNNDVYDSDKDPLWSPKIFENNGIAQSKNLFQLVEY